MIDRDQPELVLKADHRFLISFSSHCDTSARITTLVRYSRGRIDTLMELRHARAVSTWRLGIAYRMPIARDARHAVIEGTRVQQRSRFRRENVNAGYFGDHDVPFHHRASVRVTLTRMRECELIQFDCSRNLKREFEIRRSRFPQAGGMRMRRIHSTNIGEKLRTIGERGIHCETPWRKEKTR